MLRYLISLLVLTTSANPEGGTMSELIRGNNQFAVDLYRKVEPGEGNLFFSPYSISTAMAMTSLGASGDTGREMVTTLHLPTDREALEAGFAKLDQLVFANNVKQPYVLETANALWGQSGLDYRPDFLKRTQAAFRATLHPLDFAGEPEASRRTINAWVEKLTHEKIKDLLGPSAIQRDTDLILTNAIYLKAAWATPFSKAATTDQDFTTAKGQVPVPLMHLTSQFRYADVADDGLQLLEMPYVGGSLSMVVILPKRIDGLAQIESRLSGSKLENLIGKLGSAQKVEVFLPRFKLEQSFSLGDTLKSLGMTRAFGPEADFSGITTSRHLLISAVIHKAFVDVNEEGTEAAAATAVMMSRTAAMIPQRPPVVFRADHPFLFLIRDVRTGSILFLGRVSNPRG